MSGTPPAGEESGTAPDVAPPSAPEEAAPEATPNDGVAAVGTTSDGDMRAGRSGIRRPGNPPAPSREDRAVSPVIGFILMFGLLLVGLTLVQATAVPIWNQNAEYEHSLAVEEELGEFRDDILRVASEGGEFSTSVALGLVYPDRAFLVNPPNPTGTVRTTEQGSVLIEGAVAAGEAGDVWDGSAVTYTTRSIVYRAEYNQYGNAPRYVIDNTAFVADFGEVEQGRGQPILVSDRQIRLVLVNGSLQASGVGSESLTANAISAPSQTVTVRPRNGPITLRVPTLLGEAYWREALSDETVANGGHVLSVGFQAGEPYNQLTVQLETGVTYNLAIAEVGVGTDREVDRAHYIVDAGGPRNIQTGTTDRFTFQVRDRLNNPVSGVEVTARVVEGPGQVTVVQGVSDSKGMVTVEYTADAAGTAVIEAAFGGGTAPRETASVTVDVAGSGGGGGGGGGGDSDGTGGVVQWTPTSTTQTFSQEGGLWQGVDGATSLSLSNATFTPVRPSDQQFDSDKEYLRFVLVFVQGDTKYVYEFTDSKDGVTRSPGGAWSDTKVVVWRKTGDQKYQQVGTAELSTTALEALYDGRSSMDLLASTSYSGRVSAITQLRNWLRSNNGVDVYIADMNGRVTITLE